MNKQQRKRISDAIRVLQEAYDTIDQVYGELDAIKYEEQEKFDNLSEGLQESEMGETMQNAIDTLDDACSDLESARDEVEQTYTNLEELL